MDLKSTLVTKTSKKGELYTCVEIQLTPDYKKVVFLEPAELALLKALNFEEKTTNPFEIN